MTDYTPTTEEIRLRYSDSRHWGEELDAQFDRWLAEVKAQAWEKGYDAGLQRDQLSKSEFPYGTVNTNPYRKGEEQ